MTKVKTFSRIWIKNCAICDVLFIARTSRGNYCSKDCRYKNYRTIAIHKAKEWYNQNKDQSRLVRKKYYEDNKERISKVSREYRKKNKDKIKAIQKSYYQANKEKIKLYQSKRSGKHLVKNCVVCGNIFTGKRLDAKYCSKQCQNDRPGRYQLVDITKKKCIHCGKYFNAKRSDHLFCSATCNKNYWILKNPTFLDRMKPKRIKYQKKQRDELTDIYVRGLLSSKGCIVRVSSNQWPQSLVELKRIELKINRTIKLKQNEKRENQQQR